MDVRRTIHVIHTYVSNMFLLVATHNRKGSNFAAYHYRTIPESSTIREPDNYRHTTFKFNNFDVLSLPYLRSIKINASMASSLE